jgi:MOSC domain-containing protein YiiM
VAPGTVEHIHLAGAHAAPVESVEEARAEAGLGLPGDRHYADAEAEELTLVEAEALERLAAEHDVALPPGGARRNVTTRGVDLGTLVGRRFRLGEAVCEGLELCEPCNHLATLTGEPRVLRGLVHTGLSAAILQSGTIRVGDAVEALP